MKKLLRPLFLVLAFIGATLIAVGPLSGPVAQAEAPPPSAHLEGIEADKVDWKKWTKAQWSEVLSPQQVQVCREGGTERAWTGGHLKSKDPGVFTCSSCGLALFAVEDKFESGTGWPSFTRPVSAEAVTTKTDLSFGMKRVEVLCARCDAHLGHVFEDGPAPTGERWCINSVCLDHRGKADPGAKIGPKPGPKGG